MECFGGCWFIANLSGLNNVRVSGIGDGEDTNTEVLTTSGSEIDVVSGVVVNGGLGKHSVVFNFGLAETRAVGRDDDQLGLTGTEGLEGGLVPENVLTGLDNKCEARVDVLCICFQRGNVSKVFGVLEF